MVSKVGFKSSSEEGQGKGPRKKTVSRGLLVTALILGLVGAVWGGLFMWKKNLSQQRVSLESEITAVNQEIRAMLDSSDVSDFAARASIIEKELYRGHDTNDVLKEIERIMIMKDSDGSGNRVVLQSFQHSSGAHEKRTVGDVSAVITGEGNLTISADADNFDVMAQQIDMFKKSEMFTNIVVGTTDRDDSGRIIFTLTMNVVGTEKSPFEKVDGGSVQIPTPEPIITEEIVSEDGEGDVQVDVGAEESLVDVIVSDDAVQAETQTEDQNIDAAVSDDGAEAVIQQ